MTKKFDDGLWKINTATSMAVTSTATASIAALSTETYAIQVCMPSGTAGAGFYVDVGSAGRVPAG